MLQDALDAVDVVTFDYPCQLILYFSLLLVTLVLGSKLVSKS
jgi:hypothetical protein